MPQTIIALLIALFLSSQVRAADPITLDGSPASCSDFSDLDLISFHFFNPQAFIDGRALVLSVRNEFLSCKEHSDNTYSFEHVTQPVTSALEAQYWTLFTVSSWNASFVGGKIYRTASVEIPFKSFLDKDDLSDYHSGNPVYKTFFLYLDSAMIDGLSQGTFQLSVIMQSGQVKIIDFRAIAPFANQFIK